MYREESVLLVDELLAQAEEERRVMERERHHWPLASEEIETREWTVGDTHH